MLPTKFEGRSSIAITLFLSLFSAVVVLSASIVNATELMVPTDNCLGSGGRDVRYTSDGVIHLEGCDEVFTLTEIAADSSVTTDMLELVDAANKIWYLKVDLKVEEGTTFNVIGGDDGDANWLRLHSDDDEAVWIKGINSEMRFENTKVTSWDAAINDYDREYESGNRAFVAIRSEWNGVRQTFPVTACDVNGGTREYYEGNLEIIDSEMSYLGADTSEGYGVSWKVYSRNPPPERELYELVDVFGLVTGSTFKENYFGIYTFGAYCIEFANNIFEDNVVYGLDPHDDSDYLNIHGNIFRNNGNHGLICSKFCNNLRIVDNESYGNGGHGIMLHRAVNDSLVEGNYSHDNAITGISIFDSHNNIIRNNRTMNNATAELRLTVGASGNLVENNELIGLVPERAGGGRVLWTFAGSDEPTINDGWVVDNIFRNNTMVGYKSAMLDIDDARNNVFEGNMIEARQGSSPINVFEFRPGQGNRVMHNTITGDAYIGEHFRTVIRASDPPLTPAPWTYVGDMSLGQSYSFLLDSTSDAYNQLGHSEHYVWVSADNQFTTQASSDETGLILDYASVGITETVEIINLRVVPNAGEAVDVTPLTFETADPLGKSWKLAWSPSTFNSAINYVGDMTIGQCYVVRVDGVDDGYARADEDGVLAYRFNKTATTSATLTLGLESNDELCPDPITPIYLPLLFG